LIGNGVDNAPALLWASPQRWAGGLQIQLAEFLERSGWRQEFEKFQVRITSLTGNVRVINRFYDGKSARSFTSTITI
jgi:hypothetical protein